jgi:hypothetical protein
MFNNYNFYCEKCNYGCDKKYTMNRHKNTKKHKLMDNNINICSCGKRYKHIQSLNRHKLICNNSIDNYNYNYNYKNENEDLKNIILSLVEQNKNMIIENNNMRNIIKEIIPNIGNNNTIINNQLNINVFLNKECKDAINLTEFLTTIELNMDDLNITKQNGYVNGITNIFLKGLKGLELNKRPIHCSDLKKEIIYIKDNDIWEKDNNDKVKIKNAINYIAKKQVDIIKTWEKMNPNWKNNDKNVIEYCEYIHAITSSNIQKYNKIIKNIAKETVI